MLSVNFQMFFIFSSYNLPPTTYLANLLLNYPENFLNGCKPPFNLSETVFKHRNHSFFSDNSLQAIKGKSRLNNNSPNLFASRQDLKNSKLAGITGVAATGASPSPINSFRRFYTLLFNPQN